MANVCEYWIRVSAEAGKVAEIEEVLRPAIEPSAGPGCAGHAVLHLGRLDANHPWEGEERIGVDRSPGEPCLQTVEGGATCGGASRWAPPLLLADWLAQHFSVQVECGGTTDHSYYERWRFFPGADGQLLEAYTEWLPDDFLRWHARDGEVLDPEYTDDPEVQRRLREAQEAAVEALVPGRSPGLSSTS